MSTPTLNPERTFWNRTLKMHKKFGIIGKIFPFPLIFILVVIGHYLFASMTLLHKLYIKLFTRKPKVKKETKEEGLSDQQKEVNNIITASAVSNMFQ
jgi:hypothetical protein